MTNTIVLCWGPNFLVIWFWPKKYQDLLSNASPKIDHLPSRLGPMTGQRSGQPISIGFPFFTSVFKSPWPLCKHRDRNRQENKNSPQNMWAVVVESLWKKTVNNSMGGGGKILIPGYKTVQVFLLNANFT